MITLGFLIIQGGVLGVMLSCILVKEVLDSLRVGSIQKSKSFIDFSFFTKYCKYLELKISP